MNVKEDFFSERELKKTLRDPLTRAAWLGAGNFLLVHSEHAHASYPGLFLARPGSAPTRGGKKGEFRDWTTASGAFAAGPNLKTSKVSFSPALNRDKLLLWAFK